MLENRRSLIIYVYSTKQIRQLKKYGLIYYVSDSMHYVVMYINSNNYDLVTEKLKKLKLVKKVLSSPYIGLYNDLSQKEDIDDQKDDDEY
ncbi:YlbG family protein [Apilactobacillus apisilvae]|uniref:YlbG family protein n=1 Tax=Apilactobacillus apisilvae TaxID=2923364 RepID=A0ABY4PJV1_9LACO|nr:DUF2129 domain-containing protein [Apilactobacillus apisilvae]UQS85719.1 YlbG family protein [Apilactobacillus apisilvae]